ncbi:MAG: LysM peptidoglycan-binding domain-containing protein [Pseudomonadota bacterium]
MKKSDLMIYCAATALTVAGSPALAADQASGAPAATEYAPQPTVQEELVYMRDVIALQTLRLDQAEQSLSRQSELIDAQARQIAELRQMVSSSQQALASLGAAQPARLAGDYVVKSGDTLSQIARRYDTTVGAIASVNDLQAPYRLRVGQNLNVPGAAPATAARVAQADPIADQISKIDSQQSDDAEQSQQPQRVASAPAVSPGERPDVTQRVIETQKDRKPEDQPTAQTPEAVGVRPDQEDEIPELAVFADVGGVLTPKGTMFVEPGVDFATSSDNRFFFQGVEIVDAVLIGAIEATDTDRRAVTESIGVRYGLTNRIEIDGSISYVSRQDRVSGVAIDDNSAATRNLGGYGIGDANFGIHYQLNNGRSFPYTIVNLRAKAPTGTGPFDVDRDANGFDTELATGSGFWTIEPSLSFILPTSPAVIFANVGYQKNLSVTPNSIIGPDTTITEFNPGDAIRTSLGVGISVNERLSLNFGYDQSNFFKSRSSVRQENIFRPLDEDNDGQQDIREDGMGNLLDENGNTFTLNPDGTVPAGITPDFLFSGPFTEFRTTESPATTVGSFLFGGSYAVTDNFRINLNTAFGATDEAPDMRVSLRAQYKLFGK